MPNQYSALTKENIEVKLNRQRNPVHNAVTLAEEFGYTTTYHRSNNNIGRRAPSTFVTKVRGLIGEDAYRELRDSRFVNRAYK